MRNCLLLLSLLLLCSAPAAAQCIAVNGTVSLRQCGAAGNDAVDDAPALQAALDALALSQGGVLNVEGGVYRIATPVSRSYLDTQASSVIVRGQGGASVLHIAAGAADTAITLTNAENLSLEDLTFAGTPGTLTDAGVALHVSLVQAAHFRNVSFYGLSSVETGGAVLRVTGSGLTTQNLAFRGCTGAYSAGVPVMHVEGWVGVMMRDTEFIDYGTLAGVYHSKTNVPAYAWVLAGSPNQFNEPIFTMERAYLDEGAAHGVLVGTTATRPHVRISGVNQNVNGTSMGAGIVVSGAKSLKVSQSWFGFASGGGEVRNAVSALGVDFVMLEHVEAVADANRIFADASVGSLTLTGCDVGEVVSSARSNRIIESKVARYQFSAAAAVTIEKNGQVASSERSLLPDYRNAFQGGVAVAGLGQAKNVRFSNNSRNFPGNGRSYTYYVVAVDAYGRRSLPRMAVHADGWKALTNYLGGCCWVLITWDAVPGAVSYDVMRDSPTQKIGSVTEPQIIDRGHAPTAYTPPAIDETATLRVDGRTTTQELTATTLRVDGRTTTQELAVAGFGQAKNVRFSNNSKDYPGNGRSYTYYVVAVDAYGRRSLPRMAVHADGWKALTNYLGGCCWVLITWDAVPGAVSYDVMRDSPTQKIGSVTEPQIIDRGHAPTAYTPPAIDETAEIRVEGRTTTQELSVGGIPILAGAGAPAGSCTLGLYLRKDSGPGVPALYVCQDGAWVAK